MSPPQPTQVAAQSRSVSARGGALVVVLLDMGGGGWLKSGRREAQARRWSVAILLAFGANLRSNVRMGLFAPLPKPGHLERVARLAVVIADRALPRYTSTFSRHDYTQPQLVAILLLKGLLDQTYRDIYHFLKSSDSVRDALGIRKVPHWTTLERTCNAPGMQELLSTLSVELYRRIGGGERPQIEDSAIDSTGFETTVKSA